MSAPIFTGLNISRPWQATPAALTLLPQYVDIWLYQRSALLPRLQACYELLDNAERRRADRLQSANARRQFIITRGCLRRRLGWITGSDPQDIIFTCSRHGKPLLIEPARYPDLSFNVSHTEDLTLIAVGRGRNIGIDIEKIDNRLQPDALIERCFSDAEKKAFKQLPLSLKRRAFYVCWTRKEAFTKAVGKGLSYGLKNFDVSVVPGLPASPVTPRQSPQIRWLIIDLPMSDKYHACLVSDVSPLIPRYWY